MMSERISISITNTNCCVPLCNSRGYTHPELSFHKFPEEEESVVIVNKNNVRTTVNRRKLWILRLRMGKEVSKHMVVCSKHFKEDDFFRHLGLDGNVRRRKRLKRTAVPSLNLPITCKDTETSKTKESHEGPVSGVATLVPRKVEKMETKTCCSADHCNVSSGEGYAFHKFPDDEKLCAAWVLALRCKGFAPTKHSRLCSKHFTPESYIRDADGLPVLKQDAVPSIFDFPPHSQDPKGKYNLCFVPGCKSKSLVKTPENIDEESSSIHMFKVPNSDRMFQRWKNAIFGSPRDLTKTDYVCELHFKDREIERFYFIKAADGSVIKLKRTFPTLITGAVPSIYLDPSIETPKSCGSKRLPQPLDQDNHRPKKNKTTDVSDISINSEREVILYQPKSTVVKKGLTFRKVLDNLHLLKKPNNWWNIAPVNNFIMCARWDDNFIADKRIVIGSNLSIRVFLKEWEINITDLMDITCIEDISSLLEKVESYSINFPCS